MKLFNIFKLSIVSVISWLLFFWIENSRVIQEFSDKLDRVNSTNGFGVLVFLYLGKYFLLLTGVVTVVFIIRIIFNKKIKE
ncbi:hypothetical protein [Tenacibaculum sp. IB213877]|uniref:hypothetical protein n=1 Tax=Tenacibaculum sp. IB213877 TaxID=3097351 RepID=UPI002A5AE886|nr:hypothetical protein [Tenacibaculum sp. IB213877]MDY0780286.1 hypothetical protein [Tenacibaculum sp. IB213877]